MCKFNNNLFIISFLWYSLWLLATHVTILNGHPLDALLADDYVDEDTADYDLYYDQRQNGTENFRLRIDGVVIALPASMGGQAASIASSVSTDYLLALASNKDSDEDKDDDKNDDNFIDYFKYQKSAGNKVTADNSQLVEQADKDENKEKTVKKDIKPSEVADNQNKDVSTKLIKETPSKEENLSELQNNANIGKTNKKRTENKSQGRRRNK